MGDLKNDPHVRLFRELFSGPLKAFLPMLHEGVPIVAEVEQFNPAYRVVPGKRFSTFDEADLEAWTMNRAAGIPLKTVSSVHDSIKNADV